MQGVDRFVNRWAEGYWREYQQAAKAVIQGMTKDEYVSRDRFGTGRGDCYEEAKSILDAFGNCDDIMRTMYRGLTANGDFDVGDTFSEGLAGWTGDRDLAV